MGNICKSCKNGDDMNEGEALVPGNFSGRFKMAAVQCNSNSVKQPEKENAALLLEDANNLSLNQPAREYSLDNLENSPLRSPRLVESRIVTKSGLGSPQEKTRDEAKSFGKSKLSGGRPLITESELFDDLEGDPFGLMYQFESTYKQIKLEGVIEALVFKLGRELEESVIPGLQGKKRVRGRQYLNVKNKLTGLHYSGQVFSANLPLPHGTGEWIDSTGTFFNGYWEHGQLKEIDRMIDKYGHCYMGQFRDMKLHGHGIILTEKFQVEGNFEGGVCVGKMTKTYLDDATRYEGTLDATLMESGRGKIEFCDGRMWFGSFEKGKPHGEGELVTNSGEKKAIKFDNGRRL